MNGSIRNVDIFIDGIFLRDFVYPPTPTTIIRFGQHESKEKYWGHVVQRFLPIVKSEMELILEMIVTCDGTLAKMQGGERIEELRQDLILLNSLYLGKNMETEKLLCGSVEDLSNTNLGNKIMKMMNMKEIHWLDVKEATIVARHIHALKLKVLTPDTNVLGDNISGLRTTPRKMRFNVPLAPIFWPPINIQQMEKQPEYWLKMFRSHNCVMIKMMSILFALMHKTSAKEELKIQVFNCTIIMISLLKEKDCEHDRLLKQAEEVLFLRDSPVMGKKNLTTADGTQAAKPRTTKVVSKIAGDLDDVVDVQRGVRRCLPYLKVELPKIFLELEQLRGLYRYISIAEQMQQVAANLYLLDRLFLGVEENTINGKIIIGPKGAISESLVEDRLKTLRNHASIIWMSASEVQAWGARLPFHPVGGFASNSGVPLSSTVHTHEGIDIEAVLKVKDTTMIWPPASVKDQEKTDTYWARVLEMNESMMNSLGAKLFAGIHSVNYEDAPAVVLECWIRIIERIRFIAG